ncbi:MAG TPA: hypothetical protein VGX68_13865 [Thermoanaerobaculia bacterium]|jgi:hypothetical protein|nr:hypothetical protein [Thermoanaerobaculia bacterium]
MRALRALTLFFLILGLGVAPVLGNGGKGKTTVYRAEVRQGEGEPIQFSAELEAILFRLNSVRNKYKVVRVKIVNDSSNSLKLSPDQDKIELLFNTGEAPMQGILNLSKRDAALWDSLPADLRQALAYPRIVEAGEEENVFVFIADPNLARLPRHIRYHVASLPDPVEMRDITAAAKR